jgi:flagellar biosynthesis protein FliQ
MVVAYRVLPRATAYEVGDAIAGAMLLFALPSIVSAIVTGLVVSLSSRAWSMPQIALVFLPLFMLTLALQLLIARSG